MKESLTKQEQELAENNHNLIYTFANQKNLDIDNYYGILAIGLCKAAKSFDLEKGKFSTIAYSCMENELKMNWRSSRKSSAIPNNSFLHYDATKFEDDNGEKMSFIDDMPSERLTDETVFGKIEAATLINLLTDKEKEIVNYLCSGMRQSEIASHMRCSRQNVSSIVNQIRKRLNVYLQTNKVKCEV